ncbi:hypothetical protein BDR03DRAFT_1095272 [Suillus americanus]|nr:hypothetical protein BDR03DRAFT_1095272 [Suillus americanus]
MFQEVPNDAVRPDFTTEEHQPARQQLIDEGLTEDQAERTLASLWTLANNADKEHWAVKQQQLRAIRQQEEDEEQRLQLLCDEEEAARREDRKKNKNKYTPLKRGKVPNSPSSEPSIRKIVRWALLWAKGLFRIPSCDDSYQWIDSSQELAGPSFKHKAGSPGSEIREPPSIVMCGASLG